MEGRSQRWKKIESRGANSCYKNGPQFEEDTLSETVEVVSLCKMVEY